MVVSWWIVVLFCAVYVFLCRFNSDTGLNYCIGIYKIKTLLGYNALTDNCITRL